ncbi:MAG: hypothetical protein EOM54_08140 [Clostridia bacterium]|nr:hypothetical protein [Clostridia bacterium]
MMKKWQVFLLVLAVAVVAAGVGAYAATNYGTQSDPLVTVSYLTDTLEPSIQSNFDGQLAAAMEQLEAAFEADLANATGTFEVVALTNGQTLSGGAGCEILFRSGSATAVGAILDVSTGASVSSGASLTANHLYMTSASGDGVKAGGAVTLLVRGVYTIA